MSACYSTNLTITGKKKELIIILKFLNNYNENNEKIYFNGMEMNFESEILPKDFNNNFYINDSISSVSDEELEKKLSILDNNKEYTIYIDADGPYGRFVTIEDVNFFKDLADFSLDITFSGEISGGEYLPEDRLDVKYNNKKLTVKCFIYCEEYSDDYIEKMKQLLPYNKFCELFKIDKKEFNESDYNSFVWDEIGIQGFPDFYSYDKFMDNYEFSSVSKKDYQEAIKYVKKLKLMEPTEFFDKNESKYWDLSEYNSITKEFKEKGKQKIKTNDKESILNAIRNKSMPLEKISKELLNDREFVLEAVKINFWVLDYTNKELRNDKEIVLEAVRQDDWGHVLRYSSKELQNDKEVVLAAVNANGFSLEYASPKLKNDRDIVLAAAKQCDFVLELVFIDKKLFNDRELMLEIIEVWAHAIIYCSNKLKDDRRFILDAAKKNGLVLIYINEEQRNDKEVVLEAVKQNGRVLKYASDELKNDEEVVITAIKNNSVLRFAGEKIKNNKNVVLTSVKLYGKSLMYASKELKGDKEVVMEAIKNDSSAIKYASKELQKDEDILKIVNKN